MLDRHLEALRDMNGPPLPEHPGIVHLMALRILRGSQLPSPRDGDIVEKSEVAPWHRLLWGHSLRVSSLLRPVPCVEASWPSFLSSATSISRH